MLIKKLIYRFQKKLILILVALNASTAVFANMSSPIFYGTTHGSPFVNSHVDILREDLIITLQEYFTTSEIFVRYHISSDTTSINIPLIFVAMDYKGHFEVLLDGKPVTWINLSQYDKNTLNKFENFRHIFKQDEYGYLQFHDNLDNEHTQMSISDLTYFEVDLDSGEHIIEVEYSASNYANATGWLNDYEIRYLLEPAKTWKSYNNLNVTLISSGFDEVFTTNLGDPHSGSLSDTAHWSFNKMPVDMIVLQFDPKPSPFARFLILINPGGLAIISAIIIGLLHLYLIRLTRRTWPKHRFSIAVVLGSLVLPLICLWLWHYYYHVIDLVIGPYAAEYHGYTFLVLFIYPIIMPFYWLLCWRYDYYLKKKLS